MNKFDKSLRSQPMSEETKQEYYPAAYQRFPDAAQFENHVEVLQLLETAIGMCHADGKLWDEEDDYVFPTSTIN